MLKPMVLKFLISEYDSGQVKLLTDIDEKSKDENVSITPFGSFKFNSIYNNASASTKEAFLEHIKESRSANKSEPSDPQISVIFKYQLHDESRNSEGGCLIEMPLGAKILGADYIDGNIYFWAEVNPDQEKVTRRFKTFGTGTAFDLSGLSFISMAICKNRGYVVGIYEIVKATEE